MPASRRTETELMRAPLAAVLAVLLLHGTARSQEKPPTPPVATPRAAGPSRTPLDTAFTHPHVSQASPRQHRDEGDLGPSTAPPWNPPHVIQRRRVWEHVLLLPGRVATLPISLLGRATDHSLLWVESTALITKVGFVARALPEKAGIHVKPSAPELGDHVGISGSVTATTSFLGGHLKNFLTVSHAASQRHYHDTQIGILGTSNIEYEHLWRPEERFYGFGMQGTREEDVSDYAVHMEQVRFDYAFRWNRHVETPRPRTEVVLWLGPRTTYTRKGHDPGKPSIDLAFPDVAAPLVDHRFEQLVYGGRFASDWRQGATHWNKGWRVLVEVERYDKVPSYLTDRVPGDPGAQFTRTTLEMETGASFLRDPRTLRFMGRLVDQGITSGREHMLLSDYALLGSRAGLGGFQAGRFHDVDLLLGKVTWVFPLVRRLELEIHGEAGAVFPDVWRDARIDRFERSFGFAMRGRTNGRTFGAVGLDFSRESTRFRYTLGDPEPIGFKE